MRKLVTIREVAQVLPIEGADKIEQIFVDGWSLVSSKGNFQVGDKGLFFEIDSVLPQGTIACDSLPQDLIKQYNTEENELINGIRIKTIRLRKTLSQGYFLPLSLFPEELLKEEDLTKALNVYKYEPPLSKNPAADSEGSFPTTYVKKTDQERIQNITRSVYEAYINETLFEVTYKLDGSSITVGTFDLPEGVKDVVCSRNNSLKLDFEEDRSLFLLKGKPILKAIKDKGIHNLAVQGELVAPQIQGNFENVTKPLVYIYSVWDVVQQEYLQPEEARKIVEELGLDYVPIKHKATTLKQILGSSELTQSEVTQQLLKYAEGPSGLNGKYREGFVFKALDSQFSFKTISNQYLLKEK